MTSKLKCPFCQHELHKDPDGYYSCYTDNCSVMSAGGNGACGTESLWAALIQAKQDLETAKADIEDYKKYKALWEQIRNNTILELEHKLEIARKALVFVKTLNERQGGCFEEDYETQMRTVYEALETIGHKEEQNG